MVTRVDIHKFLLLILLGLLIYSSSQAVPVQAQSNLEGWTTPVNISRSGAASQPRIVASPTGEFQAFWWDQFEGLVTSIYLDGTWSEPEATTIFGETFTASPQIVADGTGLIHAFWPGEIDKITGAPTLLHTWMRFGTTGWNSPDTVAASAPVYELSTPPIGPLSVAYINTQNDINAPAGVYFRPAGPDGTSFGLANIVYQSIYYRLIQPASTSLGLASDGSSLQQIMWHDPNRVETFYALSADNGVTWSPSEPIGLPEQSPNNPRLAATPQYSLRMWQATSLGGCVLYQQRTDSLSNAALSTADGISSTSLVTPTWGTPQRIFEGLNFCPQNDQFWVVDQGRQLFWLWGQGSNSLGLTTWDDTLGEWSQVTNFSFNFEDLETDNLVSLSDLHAAITGDQMVVVGSDSTGEVWVTISDLSAQELVFQPPAPWTAPVSLSKTGTLPSDVTSSMDKDSRLFAVWSQVNSRGARSLQISRQDTTRDPLNNTGSQGFAAELFTSKPGELIRQPDLLIDNRSRLQMVWSGGTQGEIQYSWSSNQEALSPSGWSTPITLSAAGLASSPKIGVDQAGTIYVVFAVPLNEERGIYMVRSDDAGQTWSAPKQILDGAGLGWQQVDHLSLAVTADGSLHVAYVDQGIPGNNLTKGVYYQHSPDGGETWDSPIQLAGAGTDWPALVISNGQVHLIYLGPDGLGAYHRWSPLFTQGQNDSGWSTPFQVPGWLTKIAGFELAADGRPEVSGTLYIVGASADIGDLLYNSWDGSNWSQVEAFVPFSSPSQPAETGVSVATKSDGGELAVTWIAQRDSELDPSLLFAGRTIPLASVPPAPTPIPTFTPQVTIGPTVVTASTPSPTPLLDSSLPPTSPVPATLIGGIIATLVVVTIFIWRLIATQRK